MTQKRDNVRFLAQHGIDARGLPPERVLVLADEVETREQEGSPTLQQLRALLYFGLPWRGVTRRRAGELLEPLIGTIALVLVFACLPARAAVPASWLDRTQHLESRGNAAAVGDRGRSRGPYQIQERTWRRYGGRGRWSSAAHDPVESRRVAARILADCARACRRDRRPVTFANCRWYYRHGGY